MAKYLDQKGLKVLWDEIKNNNTKITEELEGEIISLGGQISSLNNTLHSYDNRLNYDEANISKIQDSISSINERLDGLNTEDLSDFIIEQIILENPNEEVPPLEFFNSYIASNTELYEKLFKTYSGIVNPNFKDDVWKYKCIITIKQSSAEKYSYLISCIGLPKMKIESDGPGPIADFEPVYDHYTDYHYNFILTLPQANKKCYFDLDNPIYNYTKEDKEALESKANDDEVIKCIEDAENGFPIYPKNGIIKFGAGNGIVINPDTNDIPEVIRYAADTDFLATKTDLSKYLPLAGGTMDNTNMVKNLNAEMIGGKTLAQIEEEMKSSGGGIADTAKNLLGDTDIANNSMYRTVGGDSDVVSGFEAASVESIRGNAIAWNQLASRMTSSNFGAYIPQNVTVDVVDGVCNATIHNLDVTGYNVGVQFKVGFPLIQGHTYLAMYDIYSSLALLYKIELNSSPKLYKEIPAKKWTRIYDLNIANRNSSKLLISPSGTGFNEEGNTYSVKNAMLFDLTLIYGAGNEPTTPEQFEADYQRWFGKPLTYEDYDAGSIRVAQPQGIKTVGFNLWDEEWEVGSISSGNGVLYSSTNQIRSKNFCRILPNQKYYCKVRDYTNQYYLCIIYYDKDKKYIGFENICSKTFTTPLNVVYFKITTNSVYVYGITYNSDICINLSWSGKRNGEYEPYWEETELLPVTTLKGKLNGEGEDVVIFPDGLKRAGTIYDEIKVENGVTKAIKRVGSVDLGTRDWSYDSITGHSRFRLIIDECLKSPNLGIIFAKYPIIRYKSEFVQDKVFQIGNGSNSDFRTWIFDDSYTDAPSFKSAMAGVILYYELATPEEYIISDFELPLAYKIDDFGTEQIIAPEGSIAPTLITRYGINAVDTLRRLPHNYISKESEKELLNLLGEKFGGKWEMTWDEERNRYKFTAEGVGDGEISSEKIDELKKELDSKAGRSELSNIVGEEVIDDDILENFEKLTREQLKKDLFIDLWNEACYRVYQGDSYRFGRYNEETGYFELNGLTDITYEQAIRIYLAGSLTTGVASYFYGMKNIRTNLPRRQYSNNTTGGGSLVLDNTFRACMSLEVVIVVQGVPGSLCFAYCSKLRQIGSKDVPMYNVSSIGSALGANHTALTSIYGSLRDNTNVNLSACPNLSLDSFEYLLEHAINTSAIQITVHADVYAKITDTGNAEWNNLIALAQEKNITFASA